MNVSTFNTQYPVSYVCRHLANILNSPHHNGYLPLERGGHVLAVLPLGEREVAAVPQQLLVRLAHVEQLHVVVGRAAANHSSVFTSAV